MGVSGYDREVRIEGHTPLAPEDAFAAWTVPEQLVRFFAARARVEPQVGGAYEMLFLMNEAPGRQGSEGCVILAWEPPHRLAFTWNAPPHLPHARSQRTVVEVRFAPAAAGGSEVELVHRGFGTGDEWDQTFYYFKAAWSGVMSRLATLDKASPIPSA